MDSNFWADLAAAQQDKFYQGLNSEYFDKATPQQQSEWLNFHLQRMANDPRVKNLYPLKDDLLYKFNSLILLFWDAVSRSGRPPVPQLSHGSISNNHNLNQSKVVYALNSAEFDKATPAQRMVVINQILQKLHLTPSSYNLNLANYWNPLLRTNRPNPPYIRPELTLHQEPITGNLLQDINSEDYDTASRQELRDFLLYNWEISQLPLEKFNKYLEHIWKPAEAREPLTLLKPEDIQRLPKPNGRRLLTYGWPTNSVLEDTEIYGKAEDAIESCPLDEDGEICDLISMSPIPAQQLVRIRTGGALQCYKLQTLIDINNATGIDPLTRLPFARDLRNDIFHLQLRSLGLAETPEITDFRLQSEAALQDFEGLLNTNQNEYPEIVDKYRKLLNDVRNLLRSAIIVTLEEDDIDVLQELQDNQTIERAVDELTMNFRREAGL